MALDRERWAKIEDLYERALARPAAERAAFVASACDGDTALATELGEMLQTDEGGAALSIERLVSDASPADARIGTRIGPWRTDALLGRGGSSVVYLVSRADGQHEQRAALKIVGGAVVRPDTIQRFDRERRILARLVHPHVAGLIDGGVTSDGAPYLVMEYVDGLPLTDYCDERRLSLDQRLQLFTIVCDTVDHAHRALVVHRDLKPSNIYVSKNGDVMLLDFGIAKLLDPDASDDLLETRTELRAFTPAYAAPEQLRHDPVTTATDVYSLGVVLYEVLTGSRPLAIEKLSPAEAERRITTEEPPAPSAAGRTSAFSSRLRGDLDRICLKALEKAPERRYASAREFGEDLTRFLEGRPILARPSTTLYRLRRFAARHRFGVAAAAAFTILLAAFATLSANQARNVVTERNRARIERNKAQEVVKVLVDLFKTSNPEVMPGADRQPIGEFLQQAGTQVLGDLQTAPDVQATMAHVLGQVQIARSDFATARTMLERSVADLTRLDGADDPETIGAAIDLARVKLDTGDKPGAQALLSDAVSRSVRTLGERHELTGRAVFWLAGTYRTPDEIEPLLERSLAIRRAVLAPDDPDIAATIGEIAVQEMAREHYDAARARFDEALAIANRYRAGRHTVARELLSNYASLLSSMGSYAQSEKLSRQALALETELVGPQSLAAAVTLNNIATDVARQDRLEEAADLLQQSYTRLVALLGPTHTRVANTARNIAIMLMWVERPAEARRWIDEAVRASETADGADTRPTVYMRVQRATIVQAQGDVAAAVRELRADVGKIEALSPKEGHYMLADTRLYLGRALLAAGDAAGAETMFRLAFEYRSKTMPATSPQIAVASCDLARALAAEKKNAEARDRLHTCAPALEHYSLMSRSLRADIAALHERLR